MFPLKSQLSPPFTKVAATDFLGPPLCLPPHQNEIGPLSLAFFFYMQRYEAASHMCPNSMTIEAQRTSPFKGLKSRPLGEKNKGKKESACTDGESDGSAEEQTRERTEKGL